jgi:hypothetical protein
LVNFLRTTTYKDSWYALTPENRSAITAAAVAYHEKYLKAGKLKDTYTFGDNGKLMTVWNVASFEELASIIMESPHTTFVNSETAAFLDHQEVVKLIDRANAAARKAAKK